MWSPSVNVEHLLPEEHLLSASHGAGIPSRTGSEASPNISCSCALTLFIEQFAIYRPGPSPPTTMKFLVLAAASATAVAAQATVGPCNLEKLLPIAQGANGKKCTADTGYGLVPPALPTDAQLPKICTNTACNGLLAELVAAVPEDCTVISLKLKSQLLDVLPGMCAKYKDASPSPTTTAPAATTASPGATTAAPGAATAAPGATTKTPDSTSKTPSTSSEAPTTAPANSTDPATTSAAPEATTGAPETTTQAPAEGSESTAGSGSEDTSIDEVSSPSATTAVPATTKPASSATKAAAAAGAVVVGAIALLL